MFHDCALCMLSGRTEQVQLLPTEHNVRRLKQVLSSLWVSKSPEGCGFLEELIGIHKSAPKAGELILYVEQKMIRQKNATPEMRLSCLEFSDKTPHLCPFLYKNPTQTSHIIQIDDTLSRQSQFVVIRSHERVSVEILEQLLVHDKHSATLHTCPDETRSNSSEQTSDTLMMVDYSQASND